MSGPADAAPWFFDAHCDTFLRVVENGADFERSPDLHVTLPGMIDGGVRVQVFAAWTLAERLQGREDEVAVQMVEAVKAMCSAHSDRFVLVRSRADLQVVAADRTKTGALCALESADPLKGDPSALDFFYDAGVRLVTLVWGDNAFCGATFGNGSGLTDKGRELIDRCEALGVMVDVSHASDPGFWDLCQAATKPFVASHSNCRTLCDNTRNLTDEMIRALGERGGVAGINLSPGFLSQDHSSRYSEYRDKIMSEPGADQLTIDEVGARMTEFERSLPSAPLSLVADHVKHLIAVGGEDCVGIGGDLDGVDSLPEGIEGVADYLKFIDLLKAAGLSSSQVNKVCHGNLMRVFEEVLPRA
jgi:membrane dipeptidase